MANSLLPATLAELIGGTDDADLLVRLRRKDPQAIAVLYDRYGKTAYNLALRILGDPVSAERAVEEAVLKCWNRISTFRQARGSALGAWLLLTTYVTTIEHLRGMGAKPENWSTEPSPLEQGPVFHGWSKELDGDYVQSLFWGLGKLDSEEKQLLDLAFFKGLNPAGLSTALARPRAEIDQLISSALAKLSGSE